MPLRHVRNKYIAHNLRTDEKAAPVPPVEPDDLPQLIEQTIPLVEVLYRCINGAGFTVESARKFLQEERGSAVGRLQV